MIWKTNSSLFTCYICEILIWNVIIKKTLFKAFSVPSFRENTGNSLNISMSCGLQLSFHLFIYLFIFGPINNTPNYLFVICWQCTHGCRSNYDWISFTTEENFKALCFSGKFLISSLAGQIWVKVTESINYTKYERVQAHRTLYVLLHFCPKASKVKDVF